MTELEKKLLISKEDYHTLLDHFNGGISSSERINYYFDTDDLAMNKNNITCRVRLKNGKYKATMKFHFADSDKSIEKQMPIYNGLEKNAFTEIGLKPKGSLATIRTILEKTEGYELVIDENKYLGHTDYELEIEYIPKHEKNALIALKNMQSLLKQKNRIFEDEKNTSNTPCTQSKSYRFFEKMCSNTLIQDCSYKSSEDSTNFFDYINNDGYMRDYFDSITPKKSICLSCSYFKGWLCDTPDGVCEYECN